MFLLSINNKRCLHYFCSLIARIESLQKPPKCDACIINEKYLPQDLLVKLRDLESWKTLNQAATDIWHFQPIIKLESDLHYHWECRSEDTHTKLIRLQNKWKNWIRLVWTDCSGHQHGITHECLCIHDKICIFCQRKSKSIKKTQL